MDHGEKKEEEEVAGVLCVNVREMEAEVKLTRVDNDRLMSA